MYVNDTVVTYRQEFFTWKVFQSSFEKENLNKQTVWLNQ